MPAGVQILNSSGILQIDENWRALTKQTIAGANGALPGGADPKTITWTGRTRPLVAWKGDATKPPTLLDRIDIVGSSWSYRFYNRSVASAGDFYQLFDVPEAFPAHGVGLLVWDAAGNEAFDSNQNYLKIIGKYDWVPGTSPVPGRLNVDVDTGITRPAGSNYWIIWPVTPWYLDYGYPSSGQYTTGTFGFYWNASNHLMARRDDIITGSGSGTSLATTVPILVVDFFGIF